MTELQQILARYVDLQAHGQSAVLATVVRVEGSAYRRPGARMLIEAGGRTTGMVSGGCLERDVCERARQVGDRRAPVLVKYDGRIGLGCDGAVYVLIEYLTGSAGTNVLDLLKWSSEERKSAILATVLNLEHAPDGPKLRRLIVREDGALRGDIVDARLVREIQRLVAQGSETIDELSCIRHTPPGGELFLEVLIPPIELVVFGNGPDAVPVVDLAKRFGWHITLVAHPDPYSVRDLHLSNRSMTLIMTHDKRQDLRLLNDLLLSPARYVGLLGSRARANHLLDDLWAAGYEIPDENLEKLYAPVGLDIGAESPEEIALAIVAEITAVSAGRRGLSLRTQSGTIHSDTSDTSQPHP